MTSCIHSCRYVRETYFLILILSFFVWMSSKQVKHISKRDDVLLVIPFKLRFLYITDLGAEVKLQVNNGNEADVTLFCPSLFIHYQFGAQSTSYSHIWSFRPFLFTIKLVLKVHFTLIFDLTVSWSIDDSQNLLFKGAKCIIKKFGITIWFLLTIYFRPMNNQIQLKLMMLRVVVMLKAYELYMVLIVNLSFTWVNVLDFLLCDWIPWMN